MEIILANKNLFLLFCCVFGTPIYAMAYVRRWMNAAMEKMSRTEKVWLIDAGVLRDPTMLDSVKEDFLASMQGSTLKLASDTTFLSSELFTLNFSPDKSIIVETFSMKEIQYEYEAENVDQNSEIELMVEAGVEVKINGFMFVCEGESVKISLTRRFRRRYVKVETVLDDEIQEIAFEVLV